MAEATTITTTNLHEDPIGPPGRPEAPTVVLSSVPLVSGAPTTAKTVEYGDPSDMPEINWTWRRVFIYMVTMFGCVETHLLAEKISDPKVLRDIIQWLIGLIALMAMLYIAGASSEAITKLVGAIKTSRRETITSGDDNVRTNRSSDRDPSSINTSDSRSVRPGAGDNGSDPGLSDPASSTSGVGGSATPDAVPTRPPI